MRLGTRPSPPPYSLHSPHSLLPASTAPESSSVGDLMDWGYSFGFFGILEPKGAAAAFTPEDVSELTARYRCHGRFGGYWLAKNVTATT